LLDIQQAGGCAPQRLKKDMLTGKRYELSAEILG